MPRTRSRPCLLLAPTTSTHRRRTQPARNATTSNITQTSPRRRPNTIITPVHNNIHNLHHRTPHSNNFFGKINNLCGTVQRIARPGGAMASAADRAAMVQLAIADNEAFESSRIELDRAGPSYTGSTVELLAAAERAAGHEPDLAFILSAGTPRPADLAGAGAAPRCRADRRRAARGVPCPGARVAEGAIPPGARGSRRLPGGSTAGSLVHVDPGSGRGGSVDPLLVPPAVARYIEDHGLYRAAGAPPSRPTDHGGSRPGDRCRSHATPRPTPRGRSPHPPIPSEAGRQGAGAAVGRRAISPRPGSPDRRARRRTRRPPTSCCSTCRA